MSKEIKELVSNMEFMEFADRCLYDRKFAIQVGYPVKVGDFGYERYLEITGKGFSIDEQQQVIYSRGKLAGEYQLSLV